MKIAQKLILVLLANSMVPLMGVGIFSYLNTQKAITNQIQIRLNNASQFQWQKIEEVTDLYMARLAVLSGKVQIRLLLNSYNATGDSSLHDDINKALIALLPGDPTFLRIHLLTPEGVVAGSTEPNNVGKSYVNADIFLQGKEGASANELFKDQDGKLLQYLASPLSLEGKFIGVVLVENRIDAYTVITSDYSQLGNTGESYLLKKRGDNSAIYLTPLRYNSNASLTVAPHFEPPDIDYRDRQVLSTSHDLSNSWRLVTKIDVAEIDGPITQQRNLGIIIILVASLIAGMSAWYLARVTTVPIRRLAQAASQIGAGDLSQRVHMTSKDEVGLLGTAFNTMTSRLQALYQNLEQQVEQRTAALNQKVTELGEAKAQDDAILDSMGEGLVVTDHQGTVLLINNIAAQLLGTTRAALQNRPITEIKIFGEDGSPMAQEDVPTQVALRTTQKTVQEIKSVHDDGSMSSLNVIATPVVQAGKTIGVVQVIRDVTREKEVDRMKTEFISLASHQLRTPLTAIKWFTEMLLTGDAGKLTKEQLQFEHNVADSTERMIQLVGSLLNISRIESGRIIIAPQPTDLNELVGGIVNDLKAKVSEKEQKLAISIHKELPKVNLDPRLIGQVYLNLLTNAIKYTPKGGEIAVIVSRSGEELVSQVTDNGYGIPKAQQNKVFQKFFRAENAVKIESDGTGLGLYLIKAIIESSGGKIWFESAEGKGTTFWFSLPMSGMKAKAGEVTLGS